MRSSAVLLAAALLFLLFFGCGDDSGSTAGGGGVAATGGAGGTATGGGGSAGTGTMTHETASYCGAQCKVAADCCNGAPGCPSSKYPYNYTCENGNCRTRCSGDDVCKAFGAAFRCADLFGLPSCVQTCTSDAECVPPIRCTGVDDSGVKFCGCTADAGCGLGGTCRPDRGLCTCSSSAECTSKSYPACAPYSP